MTVREVFQRWFPPRRGAAETTSPESAPGAGLPDWVAGVRPRETRAAYERELAPVLGEGRPVEGVRGAHEGAPNLSDAALRVRLACLGARRPSLALWAERVELARARVAHYEKLLGDDLRAQMREFPSVGSQGLAGMSALTALRGQARSLCQEQVAYWRAQHERCLEEHNRLELDLARQARRPTAAVDLRGQWVQVGAVRLKRNPPEKA